MAENTNKARYILNNHAQVLIIIVITLIAVLGPSFFIAKAIYKAPINENNIVGVYYSNEYKNTLILADNKYAYYIYDTNTFTDIMCPWYIEGNKVYVELNRLPCTIYANLNDETLFFKSNSKNWVDEEFYKISDDIDIYMNKPLHTNDDKISLNDNNELTLLLGGLHYVFPKPFYDSKDNTDSSVSGTSLGAFNNDYEEFAVFTVGTIDIKIKDNEDLYDIVDANLKKYINNIEIQSFNELEIAGNKSYEFCISGNLNEDYGGKREGLSIEGNCVIIDNSNTNKQNVIIYIYKKKVTPYDQYFEDIIDSVY